MESSLSQEKREEEKGIEQNKIYNINAQKKKNDKKI